MSRLFYHQMVHKKYYLFYRTIHADMVIPGIPFTNIVQLYPQQVALLKFNDG